MEAPEQDSGRLEPPVSPWLPAVGYLVFFAILFLPMALDGRLPGNCDTWLNGLALPLHEAAASSRR